MQDMWQEVSENTSVVCGNLVCDVYVLENVVSTKPAICCLETTFFKNLSMSNGSMFVCHTKEIGD